MADAAPGPGCQCRVRRCDQENTGPLHIRQGFTQGQRPDQAAKTGLMLIRTPNRLVGMRRRVITSATYGTTDASTPAPVAQRMVNASGWWLMNVTSVVELLAALYS